MPEVGAWSNYYLAMVELLMRAPEADAILLVQDDVLFYDRQDLRGYLERCLWPTDPPGIVSLYCSAAYSRDEPGWHLFDGVWVWGALAFIFPTELARKFATDPIVMEHRHGAGDEGCANVDVAIGDWAARNNIPLHYPCPSLAQHIGDVSALWPSQRASGYRRADRFLADLEPQ
jgi:hypothetical protein